MEIAYFALWAIVACSFAYVLYQLGALAARLRQRSDEVIDELVPLMKNLNKTLEEVNAELDRIDELVGRVEHLSERVTSGVAAVREVLASPLGKLAGLSAGARAAIEAFVKGK